MVSHVSNEIALRNRFEVLFEDDTTGNTEINNLECVCMNKNKSKSRKLQSINRNKIECVYVNARSIVNKRKELELYLNEKSVDVMGISETWLNESISYSEMSIEGYTLLRRDRNEVNKKRGGGVALYLKDEINVIQREDIFEANFTESIWCTINCKGMKTLLGVCYRPPDSLKVNDEALFSLLNRVSCEKVIVMGDFNFPELSWGENDFVSESHPFVECLNNNFLTQLVDEPSRGKNYLDLVISSDENMVDSLSVGEPFETSDHQLIRFNLICSKDKVGKTKTNYNYFKANYDEIREYIKSRKWENSLVDTDAESLWLKLKNELLVIRDKFIPKSATAKKNRAKWVTKRVTKARKAKTNAWDNYVKSGKDEGLYEQYKLKLRESVRENRKAKENFEKKLAKDIKTNSKSFYSYVSSKKRTKSKIGPLKMKLEM